MAININDDVMTLEINGKAIATATRVSAGEWVVDTWPRHFDRNQAITALALAERLAMGYGEDDAHVIARRGAGLWLSDVSRSRPTPRKWRLPSSPRSSPTSTPTNSYARTASLA